MEQTDVSYQIAVGQAIATVRKSRKVSQSLLALKVKLSTPKLVAIEQGQAAFNLQNVQKIATALGIETADLLQIAERMKVQILEQE